jgi:hypothetical protein
MMISHRVSEYGERNEHRKRRRNAAIVPASLIRPANGPVGEPWAFAGALLAAAMLALVACGGGQNVASPQQTSSDGRETLIPPETMDEIRRIFERRTPVIARCFAQAVEAGEIDKSAKGYLTVSATVQPSGQATDVGVLETDLSSQTLERCVIGHVERWEFAKPPRPFLTSHTYRFSEF